MEDPKMQSFLDIIFPHIIGYSVNLAVPHQMEHIPQRGIGSGPSEKAIKHQVNVLLYGTATRFSTKIASSKILYSLRTTKRAMKEDIRIISQQRLQYTECCQKTVICMR